MIKFISGYKEKSTEFKTLSVEELIKRYSDSEEITLYGAFCKYIINDEEFLVYFSSDLDGEFRITKNHLDLSDPMDWPHPSSSCNTCIWFLCEEDAYAYLNSFKNTLLESEVPMDAVSINLGYDYLVMVKND